MMKSKLFACSLVAAGALTLGAAVAVQPAYAAPKDPPPGGAPSARVLMVDLRRVIAESKVGHDIQRQVDGLKAQATRDLETEGKSLQAQQVQLQQQAAILAADVKARRIKEFEQKREVFQEKVQKRGGMIQGGVMKAQAQVEQALGPILQGILRERGATVLLDRSSVLLAPSAIDVSAVAVQRLDTKMSTVKVELADVPAQSGAGRR
jgi:outer membrane protein